jgi:hypothetical protein
MGRTSKSGTGGKRGIVTAEEGRLSALYETLFGPPSNSTGNRSGGGYIYPSSSSPVNLQRLQEAGVERANQLLYENPELRDSSSVMLPNGVVEPRPNPDISISDARQRVSADILQGRRPNEYERGLATGFTLTRDEQLAAQRALRNVIAQEFINKGTFDVIPPVPMDLLRRAAGATPNVPGEVKLKAKSFQNTPMPNQQRNDQSRDNRGFGRFQSSNESKEWLNRRYNPNNPSNGDVRGAINRYINTSTNKDDLIRSLTSDPKILMSSGDAQQFANLLRA